MGVDGIGGKGGCAVTDDPEIAETDAPGLAARRGEAHAAAAELLRRDGDLAEVYARLEPVRASEPARALTPGEKAAEAGVPLLRSLALARDVSEASMRRYADDYVAYASVRPRLRDLYEDALAHKDDALALGRAADLARATTSLLHRRAVDQAALLRAPTPPPIEQRAAVGEVALPVATAADGALKLVPIAGEIVLAAEAASGRSLAGLGPEISREARIADAALVAIAHAGQLLRAGTLAAAAVAEIAACSGLAPREVVDALRGLAALDRDAAVLAEARELADAGAPLERRHEAALIRARDRLGALEGAASHTRFQGVDNSGTTRDPSRVTYGPWRPNPSGATRSIDEAREIAGANGVDVPEWVRIEISDRVPEGELARYGIGWRPFGDRELMAWSDVPAKDGVVAVRVRPEVFRSDEAIVAVLDHEMHELGAIHAMLEERGRMTAGRIRALIDVRRGPLHSQAWDVADLHVRAMREEDPVRRAALDRTLGSLRARFAAQNGVTP